MVSSGELDLARRACARVLGREPPETATLKALWRWMPAFWHCIMKVRRVLARESTLWKAKRLGCLPIVMRIKGSRKGGGSGWVGGGRCCSW